MSFLLPGLQTLGQILTAVIAIIAFSLFLYALTFNLRDRVARSFALILLCVVVVFTGEALGSATPNANAAFVWFRFQWVGLIFLPATYLHFSDAVLEKTGQPSRGRRRLLVRTTYLFSIGFLVTLPFALLIGPIVEDTPAVWHLERTSLTWIFAGYYAIGVVWAWVNLWRAYQRAIIASSRRRMRYLLFGALAPALGSFPYLLFGSAYATASPVVFWLVTSVINIFLAVFLVLMAYAIAFFGVAWSDRVVKRRLTKWLLRGPVTASAALGVMTYVRRTEEYLGMPNTIMAPVIMVITVLVMEHIISLASPVWERLLSDGGEDLQFLQRIQERLLTTSDLRQFLEAILAAICDQLQVTDAFIAEVDASGIGLVINVGDREAFSASDLSQNILKIVSTNGSGDELFTWGDYWLLPLYVERNSQLIGLLGVIRSSDEDLAVEQREALVLLSARAATALADHHMQQQLFTSLKDLTPQVERIQRLRAASRYDREVMLKEPETLPAPVELSRFVKDALTDYWGGPKLSNSPLMRLMVVQRALEKHDGNPVKALRSILKQAVEMVRPEGKRRFTAEWILYNILELKFMEGHKVREVAMRLAVSEAGLYRKQRVAIEAVANGIVEMERQAQADERDNGNT